MGKLLDSFIAGYGLNTWIKYQARKTFHEEVDRQKNVDQHLIVQATVMDYNDKKKRF
jgi:hypothetical protein